MKIFWLTIVSILSVVFALSLTIQLPQVQTFIAGKVIDRVSGKIQGDISFEKVHLKPFTTLVIKNALIIDRNPVKSPRTGAQIDTFFQAQYIIARFSLEGLLKHEGIHLDKAFVSNGKMNLVLENRPDLGDGDTTAESLTRIFGIVKKKDKKKSEKELFHIRKVEIHNFRFHMFNHMSELIRYEGGINWNDLDVKNININGRELQYKGGIMYGIADKVSFVEKSGWICNSISGTTRVGRGRAIVEDLHIRDRWSSLDLPLYMMSFTSSDDFSDYIEKVKMTAEIAPSDLDFRTLQYFAPQLGDNRLKARISGRMEGYVNDFSVHDVDITSRAGGFAGKVSGRMTGLPEIEDTRIDARLKDFVMTADGLGRFITEWMPEGELDLSRFAKGTTFWVDGRVKGLLDQMQTDVQISSMIGKAEASLKLDNILKDDMPFGISGRVSTDRLDAGKIINTEIVRTVTMETGFAANIGRGLKFPEVRVDSLKVDGLYLNGYDYTNLAATGELNSNIFNGKVICNDPSLNFLLHGTFALSPKTNNALYEFYVNLGHADLHAMNIDKRGKSEISLQTSANFKNTGGGEVIGKIDVTDIMLTNSEGAYDIGDMSLSSYSKDDNFRMEFKSTFAEATYTGSAPVAQFAKDFRDITFKKELPALYKDSDYDWNGNSYEVGLRCHNMIDILSFIMPGLYIEAGTSVNAEISKDGTFNGSLNSGRLAFKKQYLKGLSAQVNNLDDNLNGDLVCNEIQVASLKLSDNHLQIYANDNHIGTGYTYDNHSELENRGEFVIHGDIERQNDSIALGIDIMQSRLYLNSKEWQILPSSMRIKGRNIDVDSFCLISDEEAIRLDGSTSDTAESTMSLDLQRFDISIFNSVIPDLGLDGALTGTARLTSPVKSMGLQVDMICDSTHVADIPLGILNIGCTWDNATKGLHLAMQNNLDGRASLGIDGSIYPKDGLIDAVARLDRLDVGYVQPMLKDIFSQMEGDISGEIILNGPLQNMEISSTGGKIDGGMLRIAYTNVPYFVDGTYHIDSRGVYFDDISVKDRFTGTGTVAGSINWDHFRDISFDTRLKVDQIEGINLTEDMADVFYGNIFGTGNIAITGPLSSIQLNIDAVTAKRGQLHIPLTAGAIAGQNNLLTFTEKHKDTFIDPYEAMMTDLQKKESKESDFKLKIRVNAQPDVEAFVEIDKASGNVLSGYGNGMLDLEVDSDDFRINGDYTISGGNYKFVAMGLVSRDFVIQDGSSIRFNGDIMESSLDINALYKTKASLSTLIADTTSVANRRNVECGISISDKIINPRLSFSIQIPDLDPTIKSRVESALSTEDKVQKQFLSLILSNSFLPDEQSGIVNNSSMLYSNVTEMLANQLSNIFQKLDIPLDLGLNYQPNDKGTDIFDIAVSTQLFNNRVVVNGSVGNKQYGNGGTQDVVGDLDIEIKIDRSGSFRLNLFSHSADSYTNYLDNSQRNGVGLTYQTEFNNFGQFFRNMFMSKARRQAAKRAEEQAMLEGGKTNITIEQTSHKSEDRNDRRKR